MVLKIKMTFYRIINFQKYIIAVSQKILIINYLLCTKSKSVLPFYHLLLSRLQDHKIFIVYLHVSCFLYLLKFFELLQKCFCKNLVINYNHYFNGLKMFFGT